MPAAAALATVGRRPAAVLPAAARSTLQPLRRAAALRKTSRAACWQTCVAAAGALSAPNAAAPLVLAGAAALGLTQPAAFTSLCPCYVHYAIGGAALLSGLTADLKVRRWPAGSGRALGSGSHSGALTAQTEGAKPALTHASLAGCQERCADGGERGERRGASGWCRKCASAACCSAD